MGAHRGHTCGWCKQRGIWGIFVVGVSNWGHIGDIFVADVSNGGHIGGIF